MIISLISILTINHVIGRENLIPWYFYLDMCWFKYHTIGKPVIMGRKTFESINKIPLLGRLNIILSNQWLSKKSSHNVYIVNTLEQALSVSKSTQNEVMIIGGSSIYNAFLPKCTRMYLTYIDYIYKYGDAWFPKYNENEWRSICNIYVPHKFNNKYYYNLNFKILERY